MCAFLSVHFCSWNLFVKGIFTEFYHTIQQFKAERGIRRKQNLPNDFHLHICLQNYKKYFNVSFRQILFIY